MFELGDFGKRDLRAVFVRHGRALLADVVPETLEAAPP
jgi:hypothetical protein